MVRIKRKDDECELYFCGLCDRALRVQYLFSEEGGLVGPISGRVAGAPHGFHMGDGHTQDGQLIRFAGEGAAGRDHV